MVAMTSRKVRQWNIIAIASRAWAPIAVVSLSSGIALARTPLGAAPNVSLVASKSGGKLGFAESTSALGAKSGKDDAKTGKDDAKTAKGDTKAAAPSASATSTAPALANAGAASVPPITPTEKKAARLSKEALGADFDAGHYKTSEKKLKDAIKMCAKPDACSDSFQARLHRDLGFLYIAGLEQTEDGIWSFIDALKLDETVILPFTQQTHAVTKAFAEAKAKFARGETERPKPEPPPPPPPPPEKPKPLPPAPKPAPAQKAPKAVPTPKAAAAPKGKKAQKGNEAPVEAMDIQLEEEPEPAAKPAKPESKQMRATASSESASESGESGGKADGSILPNWVSLSLQQDLVLHSKAANVCAVGSRYECFDTAGAYHALDAGAYQIPGTTVGLGSTRALLGFDRVVLPYVTIGARLGAVLLGSPARLKVDPSFMFVHAEARASLWLGDNLFAKTGIRPYLYLNGGLAEADGKIPIALKQPNGAIPLDAWKRSGHSFVGVGLGMQYAITQNRAPFAELGYQQFLGPPLPVIAIELGYALGF